MGQQRDHSNRSYPCDAHFRLPAYDVLPVSVFRQHEFREQQKKAFLIIHNVLACTVLSTESHCEFCAVGLVADGTDRALMSFHDTLCDSQPEAISARLILLGTHLV